MQQFNDYYYSTSIIKVMILNIENVFEKKNKFSKDESFQVEAFKCYTWQNFRS